MDTGIEAVITKILVEDSRGVFRGQVGQDDIYNGAHVYGDCVRLRASTID